MKNKIHKPDIFVLDMYESAKDLHEVEANSDEELKELEALCISPDGSPPISDENPENSNDSS